MEFRHSFLLLIALFIGFSECQLDEMAHIFKSNKKYCGKHLSAALSAICHGNYNTIYKKQDREIYQKKSYWDPQYRPRLQVRDLGYPFMDKVEVTSMMSSNFRRRRKRGVYNECCEKPCSHEELYSYCAATPAITRR